MKFLATRFYDFLCPFTHFQAFLFPQLNTMKPMLFPLLAFYHQSFFTNRMKAAIKCYKTVFSIPK